MHATRTHNQQSTLVFSIQYVDNRLTPLCNIIAYIFRQWQLFFSNFQDLSINLRMHEDSSTFANAILI
jgi:hypothetical protein